MSAQSSLYKVYLSFAHISLFCSRHHWNIFSNSNHELSSSSWDACCALCLCVILRKGNELVLPDISWNFPLYKSNFEEWQMQSSDREKFIALPVAAGFMSSSSSSSFYYFTWSSWVFSRNSIYTDGVVRFFFCCVCKIVCWVMDSPLRFSYYKNTYDQSKMLALIKW